MLELHSLHLGEDAGSNRWAQSQPKREEQQRQGHELQAHEDKTARQQGAHRDRFLGNGDNRGLNSG